MKIFMNLMHANEVLCIYKIIKRLKPSNELGGIFVKIMVKHQYHLISKILFKSVRKTGISMDTLTSKTEDRIYMEEIKILNCLVFISSPVNKRLKMR